MPTYEYRCRDCGREFELFQRMSDPPVAPCPKCGTGSERLISGGAGFLFKGDGFYITDYRSEDYRKKARAESDAASGKPDSKSGSKPSKSGAKATGSGAKASGSGSKSDKAAAGPASGKGGARGSGTGRGGSARGGKG